MTKLQFFKPSAGLTVGEIAGITGAVPCAGARLDQLITDIAPIDRAGPSDLAYLDGSKHVAALSRTRAGACLMTTQFESEAPSNLNVLRATEPYQAFIAATQKLYPDALRPSSLFETKGMAGGAIIHASAKIENGATIDPGAVIGPGAGIGSGSVISATVVIGPNVQIGRNCSIGPGASIIHALIGDNVIIHPGCRIGQDGFRYHAGPRGHIKVPQIGRVIIQDNVEIGANTTIDRGGMGDTVIGEGTKIDNLVQIGHNVSIGRHCIIVSQCGISGSAILGDYVVLGGQVGIKDHTKIGEGAMIGGQAGVVSDVPAGEKWLGFPARPAREFLRAMASLFKQSGEEKKRKN